MANSGKLIQKFFQNFSFLGCDAGCIPGKFLGHQLDRITGKLIQTSWNSWNIIFRLHVFWMSFPEFGLAWMVNCCTRNFLTRWQNLVLTLICTWCFVHWDNPSLIPRFILWSLENLIWFHLWFLDQSEKRFWKCYKRN